MRSPVPIFTNDAIYRELEVVKPSGAVIADTKKVADTGDVFSAIKTFLSGCIVSIEDVTDRATIKTIVPKMSYKTAETIALSIMTKFYPDDDGVEGVYPCPRCNHPAMSEYREEDGMIIDTRDYISQLPILYYDGEDNTITVELETPVVLKNEVDDRVLEEIEKFTLQYPTIENGINAYNKIGVKDTVRLSYQMYIEALTTVNGQVPDKKWKNLFGMPLFNSIKDARTDIGKIAKAIRQYGIQTTIEKTCLKCGKVWRPEINTTNFFVSALQLD